MRVSIFFSVILLTVLNQGFECKSQSSTIRYVRVNEIKVNNEFFNRIEILKDSIPGPGSFHKVKILRNDKIVFEIEDVFDSINNVFHGVKNLVKSDLLFLFKLNDNYFMSFFGFQYGCCPRKLIVIRVGSDGFTKIFDEEFDVSEMFKADGHSFLINGRPIISQGLISIDSTKVIVGSYSPHLIYRLNRKLELDSVRTRKWNETNYVFRGFQADQDIWIGHSFANSKKQIRPYVFKEKNEKLKNN